MTEPILAEAAEPSHSSTKDLLALTKPRITVVVLATAMGGLMMAPMPVSSSTTLSLLFGTWLIVAGANALNMFWERDSDRLMSRTRTRPLPAGRMKPAVALVVGTALSLAAIPVLALGTNPITTGLAVAANLLYVFLYTPLKAKSWTAVFVGAIPGAIPPLLGWTAATRHLDMQGASLFAFMFVWQIPHFHAIALCRHEEYSRAGLKVLPAEVGSGMTKRQITLYTLMLVAFSLAPYALQMVSRSYLWAMLVLNAVFVSLAISGLRPRAGQRWARYYFFASMPYLVLTFVALLATKITD